MPALAARITSLVHPDSTENGANRLLISDIRSAMESVKRHYDALVKGINRDRKEDKFHRLEKYQIKYTVVNLNLRQHVFKWGLKEWGMMHEMKALAGLDNASSSKFANMGKRLDNKNFFSKGKLPIPHYPYYGEIWGKVAVSSRKA